ncbi:MAG TPA: serine/threonine-protein kinase, partial [Kofleriaceae bacterium]|nr:serine/threonine-protein kinase [Kofleriaceae bacterium]
MDETFDDPRVGQVVQDRYRILERLADGSMGVVYAGERLQIGRKVAIKFLHASYAGDKQFIQRFERETVVMSRLAHPHCVSVIDFGVEGSPYLVMEFVSGVTLRSLLETGPLPLDRAAAITRQILAGLAHAHAQGIVHRDIKPANIMLSEATGTGDHVRILDFGLATLRDAHSSDLSQTAVVIGTPNYMSPEQSMATKVDARSDIYSTGVVLFELVTGRKPFTAEDTYELLLQHRSAPVPRLDQIQPDADFPPALQDVIDRALAKQPEDRFQSAIEFADALDAALAPATTGTLAPIPAVDGEENAPSVRNSRGRLAYAPTAAIPAQPGPRRGGSLAALVAVAIVGGAAWAGYRAWQSRASGAPAAGAADEAAAGAGTSDPAALPSALGAAAAADTPAAPPPADAGPVGDAAAVMTFVVTGDGGVAIAAGDAGVPGAEAALPGLFPGDAGADGDASLEEEEPEEPPLPAEEQEEPVAPVTETGDVDLAEPKTETEAESKATTT